MDLKQDKAAHVRGILKLIDPLEVDNAQAALKSADGRERWLRRLRHQIEMHPDFSVEPPRGNRDKDGLLNILVDIGAPPDCYIFASDSSPDYGSHRLDDSFHSLRYSLAAMFWECSHGTILSCIPGKLALFRSAHPHRHYIIQR